MRRATWWQRGITRREGGYARAYSIWSLEADPTALHRLLTREAILDAAYHLNATLMREGSRAHARHHNPAFAASVLRALPQP